MTQDEFNKLGKNIKDVVAQLNNGMITVAEFVQYVASLEPQVANEASFEGLTCPFTGLTYPTWVEQNY